MRVHASVENEATRTEAQEFSDFLLRIGEGREPHFNDYKKDFKYLINLPKGMITDSTVGELIRKVFPDLNDTDSLIMRAILCPKNEDVDMFNNIACDLIEGKILFSNI